MRLQAGLSRLSQALEAERLNIEFNAGLADAALAQTLAPDLSQESVNLAACSAAGVCPECAWEPPHGASSTPLSSKGQLSITFSPCADLAPFKVTLNPI